MLAGMHGGATPGKVIMGLKIVKCDQVKTDKFTFFIFFTHDQNAYWYLQYQYCIRWFKVKL